MTRLALAPGFSDQWQLPLYHNNPWIYLGYVQLVLRLMGQELNDGDVVAYYEACEVPGRPGLLNRFPGGAGGQTSHDEVMGAASLSQAFAREILAHLDLTDGNYDNFPERPDPNVLRWNIYRFPWLRPYLAACAGYNVSLVSQAVWSGHVVWSALHPDGAGPALRIWLMGDKMRQYPLCYLALRFWKSKQKRGLNECLAIEPGILELAELAPKEWRWP